MTTKLKILLIIALFVLAGCGHGRGVYHTVKKGQTFWRICYTYKVDIQDVAEINNIRDPSKIKAGQKVFIPGRTKTLWIPPPTSKVYKKKSSTPIKKKVKIEKGRFAWPLKGEVINTFGIKGKVKHDGIDIKARRGTIVKAADAGIVAHSARAMRGFGNIIIIKHKGDFYSVYAHNDVNLVKKGQKVKKGDAVAKVGRSGDSGGVDKLHFEIRDGSKVRNPLFFLP